MKRVSSILLAIVIAVSSMFVGDIAGTNTLGEVSASSSSYKIVNWTGSCEVNKATYYLENSGNTVKKLYYGKAQESPTYNICLKKNNVSTVLVKNVESTLMTNGKYLYYVKYRNYRANIYRMTIKTKKSKKICTAPKKASYYRCMFRNIKGKYLYYVSTYDSGDFSDCTYVYNTKTKKNKKIGKALSLTIWGNQLILRDNSTESTNMNVYFAKLNGTKKKKIVSATDYFLYNKKLYWLQQRYLSGTYTYRIGCCNKKGNGKKNLTAWSTDTELSYFPELSATKKEKKAYLKKCEIISGCQYKESRKTYKDSNKMVRGVVSYEYPQFSGKSKAIKKVNADIRKQCKKFMNSSDAKDIKKQVKTAIKQNYFTSYNEYYYYEATPKITYKKKNIVSIRVYYEWNAGGTYPSYGYKNLTYNTKTGKRLSYKNVISGNAKQKVVKACKKYFNGDTEVIKKIKKKKSYQFYLQDGKAYICFNRGELYITGAPVVPVTAKYK